MKLPASSDGMSGLRKTRSSGQFRSGAISRRAIFRSGAASLVIAAALGAGNAVAQENKWEGDASQDWYNDENWSDNSAPVGDGQSDEVIVDTERDASPVIEFFDDPSGLDRAASSLSATIGSIGRGELTIRNAGSYRIGSGGLTLGDQAGADGLVTIAGNGSSLNISGRFSYVGRSGRGTLAVQNGADFENDTTVIGFAPNSEGQVTVSGSGSTWTGIRTQLTTFPSIFVGSAGTGVLTIENGGTVVDMSSVHIGLEAGGNGTVTVTGANALLESGSFFIGGGTTSSETGTGTLVISDGGTVSSFETFIGRRGSGSASVSGAESNWDINGTIYIGERNAGTLAITDGGVVTAKAGILGRSSGGSGAALVSGSGSRWDVSGDLFVGAQSEGSLTLSDGGHVSVGGTLNIAEQNAFGTPSTGTVFIGSDTAPAGAGTIAASEILFGEGEGTLVFNHTGTAHQFDTSLSSVADGQGTLSHRAGTTLLTADSSAFSGATRISGGTVLLTGDLGGSVSLDSIGPELAALGGTGRLGGDLTVTNGLLRPGIEEGTLTIDGNLALGSGAKLRFDLGSPSGTPGVDSDLLTVGGDLVLDGTLDITDVGGFGEGLYRLINYGGVLTDNGLAIGASVPTGYDETNLTVQTAMAGQINLLAGPSNDPGSNPIGLAFWNGTRTVANGSIAGGFGTWSASGTNWTNADGSQAGAYDPDAMLIFAGEPGLVTVDASAGPITTRGLQFAVTDYGITGDAITLVGDVTIRVGDGTALGAAMTALIDSDLVGEGMLIKDDLGTLILNGQGNAYEGGIMVKAGMLVGNGNSLRGDIVNEGIVQFSDDAGSVYFGNITGTGIVTKTGLAETTILGANTYSGGTFIQDGTLRGNTLSLQGEITIGQFGALVFDQDLEGTFAGQIGGDGRLEKFGEGLVRLAGTTSHTGGTTLAEGILVGTTDSLQGQIFAEAGTILAFDQDFDGTFAGLLGGEAILLKAGTGTLTLAPGDYSFFGGVVEVNGGTLVIDALIGKDGIRVNPNGRLEGNVRTLAGNIVANGTLAITEDSEGTYGFRLSGDDGGLFIKEGAGVLRLTGENDFSGLTEIRAGMLAGTTQSLTGNYNVSGDTALIFEQNGNGTFAGTIAGTGSVFKRGEGEVHLTGSASVTGGIFIEDGILRGNTSSLKGNIDTGTSASNRLIFDQDADGTFAGEISGQGSLVKVSAGRVRLTGGVELGVDSFVLGGTLEGTTENLAGFISVAENATLLIDQDQDGSFIADLAGDGILAKRGAGVVTLNGPMDLFEGTVEVRSGTLVVETAAEKADFDILSPGSLIGTADTLLGDIDADGTLTIIADSAGTLAGQLSGNGGGKIIKEGAGVLSLTQVNDFRGLTEIRAGGVSGDTQSLTGDYLLSGSGSTLAFAQDSNGSFAGTIEGIGRVTKSGTGEVHLFGFNSYTGGTFIEDGLLRGNTSSLQGNIDTGTDATNRLIFDEDNFGTFFGNISGQGSVVKVSAGRVRLSGAATHTGGTAVLAGILEGTTDNLQGFISISENAQLRIDQDSNGSFAGTLRGNGDLVKAGDGVVILDGNANDFLGKVEVNNGTLVAQTAIGRGGISIASPGSLNGTVATLVGDISLAGRLTITEQDDATYAVRLAGNPNGVFIKEGAGILRLTGANTFPGRTDVRGGVLLGNTASLTSSSYILLDDTLLVFSQDADGTFGGEVVGAGALIKSGTGELRLTSANSYTGGTTIAQGTLRGNSDSLQGDIDTGLSASNNLIFDQSSDGTYAGAISGDGRLIKDAAGQLHLAGITSHDGGTFVLGGTLSGTTDSLQGFVSIFENATLGFDQDSNGTFAGVLQGSGALIKDGTGSVTLTGDSSGFAGETEILAGVLAVTGSLGGSITVTGGALKGTGTFGNVATGNGATFAPGNSVGQTNAAGMTFEAGSIFEVELNDGGFARGVNNDTVSVTGSATLNGGTVVVIPENGTDTGETYLPGTYTILTADGGVNGAFDAVTDGYVFLDFALEYDPTAVYLRSNQVARFSDIALTANQAGIGGTLDALGGGNEIVTALLGQTDEAAARDALDSLTGELYASLPAVLVDQARITRDATRARHGAVHADALELWIQGLAGDQRRDATDGTARLEQTWQGFLAGADAAVIGNLRLGAFAGYTHSDTAVADRGSTASLGSTHLGAYAAGQLGGFSLEAGADIAWHDIDANRLINFGGFSDRLESSYSARTSQIHAGLSYNFKAGSAIIAPFGEIARVWHSSEGFAENGGPAALEGEEVDSSATFTTLGVRFGAGFAIGRSRADFNASVGWRHGFDEPERSTHELRAGGDSFKVSGALIARNALSLGLGSRVSLSDRASLSVGYNADVADRFENHSFRAGISLAF
ncbi:autotransporter-associated beta strand repeat-containing protein [Erythrobacter sp.]|uniref:autotransporter-associated beta strand repeat-containing protein n=1 Tax=Erythrobacter sp. TaxID=1042 RepID=UPI0025F35285|nr:autotransporter-associated beta strand repeat-containing protein [Erythrobacter sp.]